MSSFRSTFVVVLLVAGIAGAAPRRRQPSVDDEDLAAVAPRVAAADIIAASIAARGGRSALRAIESLRLSGSMLMGPLGARFEAPFGMVEKRPSMMRIDLRIQGMAVVQACDGEGGWLLNPLAGLTTPKAMTADMERTFREQSHIEGPLLDPHDKGYDVELLGKVERPGGEVYQLKLSRDGDVVVLSLDAESFLERSRRAERDVDGRRVVVETTFGDYRRVGKVFFPHSIRASAADQQSIEIAIREVEIDPELDRERFAKPE